MKKIELANLRRTAGGMITRKNPKLVPPEHQTVPMLTMLTWAEALLRGNANTINLSPSATKKQVFSRVISTELRLDGMMSCPRSSLA
jgi:hypothetical protein